MSTEDLNDRGALHDDVSEGPSEGVGPRLDFWFDRIGKIGWSAFGDGGAVHNDFSTTNHYWQTDQRPGEPGGGFKSVAEALAEQLREVFVEPPEFSRARHVLRRRNMVLLTGPEGGGRRAAAVRLLDEVDDTNAPIVENDSGGEENESDSRGDRSGSAAGRALVPGEEEVVDGARILINLSAVESAASLGVVHSDLDGLHRKARERGAFLAVVLPERHGEFDRDFNQLLVELRAPSPESVLQRHLEFQQVRTPPSGAGSVPFGEVQLREHLATWSMDRVALFARFVRRARDADPQLSLQEWCRRGYQALTRHAVEVQKQVGDSRPWQRALLFSAAMLVEANVDSVYLAAVRLQQQLHVDSDALDPLWHQGVVTDLGEIGVTVAAGRRVRFSLLDYDTAVRTYFWSNYPGGVRDSLRDWVRDCVADRGFEDEDRARLVAGFVEQAVWVGRARDVCEVAQYWCACARNRPELAQSAWSALANGVRQPDAPEAAGEILRQLYRWAGDSTLSRELGRVLVDVCARVIVGDRPTAAITRLRLLAGQSDSDVAESACLSMVELAGDRRLCRRFLARTRIWLDPRKTRWRGSDARLFLRVVDEAVLPELGRSTRALQHDEHMRTCLVEGMRVAWRHDRALASGHLRNWFETAATVAGESRDSRAAGRLIEVLVDALAGAERTGLAQLYVRARDWAALQETENRRAVYGIVADRVDRAAGIQWDSEENRW
ncbi:hypothetical protein GCM10027174_04270 [Salinifilum aidingensis]